MAAYSLDLLARHCYVIESWNVQLLSILHSEKDFVAIVDLPEGSHQYKFLVDGEWKVSPGEAAVDNAMGTQNNMITINEADFEEFENALLRDPNDKKDDKTGAKNSSGKEKEGKGFSTLCLSKEKS